MQAHKIICRFRKAASSLVSSPHSPFVSARKCLEWGMKILACPCSSERVFLQLQHALGSSEQGAQVRFPPQIAILTKKSINTHITFHSESFWVMRVTRRSLENKIALQFSISNIINKPRTYTSHQGLGRKAVIYGRIYQKMKSLESSLSNMIMTRYTTRGFCWLVLVFWKFSFSTLCWLYVLVLVTSYVNFICLALVCL